MLIVLDCTCVCVCWWVLRCQWREQEREEGLGGGKNLLSFQYENVVMNIKVKLASVGHLSSKMYGRQLQKYVLQFVTVGHVFDHPTMDYIINTYYF